MRNLNELFEGNDRERVWIWLGTDENMQNLFLENCRESGIPTDDIYPNAAVALHRDGAIRYVSMMVWSHSFKSSIDVVKIDYKKFVDGEGDCEITQSNLTFLGFQPADSKPVPGNANDKPETDAQKKLTHTEKVARLLSAGLSFDEICDILDDGDNAANV